MAPRVDDEDAIAHRRHTPWGITARVAAALVVVAALAYAASRVPVATLAAEAEGLGSAGLLAFAGVYVVAAVLFVPVWILNVAAGAAFGFLRGTAVAVVGVNLAAIVALLLARALGRARFERHLGRRVDALDHAVAGQGFRIVLLLRLAHFPYAVLNTLLGLSRVSLGAYASGTLLGMLPGVATLAYVGSVLGSAAGARAAVRDREPVEWVLVGVAALAAVACAVVLARIARRTIGRHAHGAWT